TRARLAARTDVRAKPARPEGRRRRAAPYKPLRTRCYRGSVLRRALLVTSLALLGCGGAASAQLVAAPTGTDPLATGPSAVPPTTTVVTTTAAATTTARVTTTAPVTTRAATTTSVAPTTTETTTTPSLAQSAAASTLVLSGHGWGHGIGMAQWGANGYAQHGWDYRQILAHYYQGTTVAAGPSPTARVLL